MYWPESYSNWSTSKTQGQSDAAAYRCSDVARIVFSSAGLILRVRQSFSYCPGPGNVFTLKLKSRQGGARITFFQIMWTGTGEGEGRPAEGKVNRRRERGPGKARRWCPCSEEWTSAPSGTPVGAPLMSPRLFQRLCPPAWPPASTMLLR